MINAALQQSYVGRSETVVQESGRERVQEMNEKIAALKSQSWIYVVGAFAVLIVIGILTS